MIDSPHHFIQSTLPPPHRGNRAAYVRSMIQFIDHHYYTISFLRNPFISYNQIVAVLLFRASLTMRLLLVGWADW